LLDAPITLSTSNLDKSQKGGPTVTPPKSEKKALKKARAREKKAGSDELDQALAELSLK
jgi:hypothetical protein